MPYSLTRLWVYLQLWETISSKFRYFASHFVSLICRGTYAIARGLAVFMQAQQEDMSLCLGEGMGDMTHNQYGKRLVG